MLKKYPQFGFAFAIVFFAELFAVTNNLTAMRFITKPLITISLMLFIYLTIKKKSRFTSKVKIGLFFSLLGDVFLMFSAHHQLYFMLGLGSFLIAHLFYIAAFYVDLSNKAQSEKRYILPIFIVFGFSCLSYYYFLRPYLGNMNIPVLVYCFVIALMGITAALRHGKTNYKSFLWILLGAILFIISDATLAYNKFVERMDMGDFWVMFTYMLAQFLICMGTIERKYLKPN
ncbi:lysoplasmalogenase [Pedobacter nanyangensis]|uniref:lysoplasmalogenase n=1 Tax=Pedobacter nanyangensis TaxID=1562389 RepID=UPI000DE29AFC|nr:lysoplasmalogenase [Pedobacter nanyangensis]